MAANEWHHPLKNTKRRGLRVSSRGPRSVFSFSRRCSQKLERIVLFKVEENWSTWSCLWVELFNANLNPFAANSLFNQLETSCCFWINPFVHLMCYHHTGVTERSLPFKTINTQQSLKKHKKYSVCCRIKKIFNLFLSCNHERHRLGLLLDNSLFGEYVCARCS